MPQRLASSIHEIADVVLADALLSLAYAADLGDPDGAAMLARNVALRHDFGFGRKDADVRARSLWAVPRQDFLPGVPWHVTGSVLGLDVAMASLTLRRISPDRIADAPRLPSNERDAFAIGLTSMNARALERRGSRRDRVGHPEGAGANRRRWRKAPSRSRRSATRIGLDGWRRRAIPWMLTHDNAYVPEMFSLVELLMLGGGMTEVPPADLDAWGTTALQSEGCACTRMTTPRTWRLLSGRPQMAFMAAGIPDLNLFLATALAELRLPASLMRSVLAPAILDFVEGVAPTDPNDLWSVARAARTVPRELIEDYVAAAAAVDGPLVPDETELERNHDHDCPVARLSLCLPPLLFMLALSGRGQEPPQVQIVSPEPGSYLSGPTQLKAGVEPPPASPAVTFFVDGRQVCEMVQPPFECEWDAGPDVTEHQVRLVVTPLTGPRSSGRCAPRGCNSTTRSTSMPCRSPSR